MISQDDAEIIDSLIVSHSICAGMLEHISNQISEIGDDRPISGCAFSPDGQQILTGSWSGTVKLWDAERGSATHSFKAHTDRITGIAWHPGASTSASGQARC